MTGHDNGLSTYRINSYSSAGDKRLFLDEFEKQYPGLIATYERKNEKLETSTRPINMWATFIVVGSATLSLMIPFALSKESISLIEFLFIWLIFTGFPFLLIGFIINTTEEFLKASARRKNIESVLIDADISPSIRKKVQHAASQSFQNGRPDSTWVTGGSSSPSHPGASPSGLCNDSGGGSGDGGGGGGSA